MRMKFVFLRSPNRTVTLTCRDVNTFSVRWSGSEGPAILEKGTFCPVHFGYSGAMENQAQSVPDFSFTECSKILIDYVKHIMTLASGSIVLIATFSDKLAKATGKGFMSWAFVCFIASLIVCTTFVIQSSSTQRNWTTGHYEMRKALPARS